MQRESPRSVAEARDQCRSLANVRDLFEECREECSDIDLVKVSFESVILIIIFTLINSTLIEINFN